MKYDQRNII